MHGFSSVSHVTPVLGTLLHANRQPMNADDHNDDDDVKTTLELKCKLDR